MDERQAIEHLQRGDIRGLEALVRLHQVRAIRTAYLFTRERQLAQDIVQAAFLRAYERIGQLDPHRPFGPWFLTSVLHDAIKAAARRPVRVAGARAGGDQCGVQRRHPRGAVLVQSTAGHAGFNVHRRKRRGREAGTVRRLGR